MFFKRFRKRQKPQFSAIQFSGCADQAAEIAKIDPSFIRKYREGGLIIEVYYPDNQQPRILSRGDWLVKTKTGGWLVLSDQVFYELFEEIA